MLIFYDNIKFRWKLIFNWLFDMISMFNKVVYEVEEIEVDKEMVEGVKFIVNFEEMFLMLLWIVFYFDVYIRYE